MLKKLLLMGAIITLPITAIAITVLLIIFTATSTEVHIDAPSSYCTGTISKTWLDIVFLVDSSAAMTQNGLRNAEAFVKSAMRQLSIGGDVYQQSRVGIVTYAAESTVVRDLSRTDNTTSTLPYDGDKDSNLLGGISTAVDMFNNYTSAAHHQQVIVIAASTYKQGGPNDPQQVAAQFAIGGGFIVTIDYKQQSGSLSPLSSLATNGFAFTNDDNEPIVSVLILSSWPLPPSTDLLNRDVGAEMFQSDWIDAVDSCTEGAGFLVKIDDEDKQKALDKLTKKPYWIGLKYDQPRKDFFWQDWSVATFTRWGISQPDLSVGECAYSSGTYWYSSPCDGDETGIADHIYYCEMMPCAAGRDCFHPVAPVVTVPPLPTTTEGPEETTTEEQKETSSPPESTPTEDWRTTAAAESTTTGPTEAIPTTTTEEPYTGPTSTTTESSTSW